jgi:hypothetical protein
METAFIYAILIFLLLAIAVVCGACAWCYITIDQQERGK